MTESDVDFSKMEERFERELFPPPHWRHATRSSHGLTSDQYSSLLREGIVVFNTKIGEGNLRRVHKGGLMHKGKEYPVSILIPKEDIDQNSICTLINKQKGNLELNEARVLDEIGYHPNVVMLACSFEFKEKTVNVQNVGGHTNLESFVHQGHTSFFPLANGREFIFRPSFYTGRIIRGVTGGLSHIHNKGYIHRDLKPSNILVDHYEHNHFISFHQRHNLKVRIADFQIASPIDFVDEKGFPTRGSTKYASTVLLNPLVTGEHSKASQKTDVHATGGIFYKVLTGRDPSQRRIERDENNGREITVGNETLPVSLFDVDRHGNWKRFPYGIGLRDEERRAKRLSKHVPQVYRNLIYCCMTPTSKGFNCGQELAGYVDNNFDPQTDLSHFRDLKRLRQIRRFYKRMYNS